MTIYKVDRKKRRAAIKAQEKRTVKEARGFIGFTFYLTMVFRILAVAVGLFTTYLTYISQAYFFEYIVPLGFFGALYALSAMSSVVYKGWALGALKRDYSLPLGADRELLSYDGSLYKYVVEGDSARLDGADTSMFVLAKDSIERIEYDEEIMMLTLTGEIKEERYNKEEHIPEADCIWTTLNIMNVFRNIDLYEELKKS